MRKGSTSLGSLGVTPRLAGMLLLILPILTAGAGTVLVPAAGWAEEDTTSEADQALRDALRRRLHWLKSRQPAGVDKSPARGAVIPLIKRVINTRATWYGPGFHGRRTANGERFNQNAMTLASRHLPFGTRVRVVNLKTGKAAIGRVNDRGPFVRGYTADLSRGLAQKIGLKGSGPVRLEILHGVGRAG